MTKDRFRWHFTFRVQPLDEVTIEEDHPDMAFLKGLADCHLVAATLIDVDHFSLFEEEERQFQSVIHSIRLEPCKLSRVFRRVEVNLTTGTKRIIPAFTYRADTEHHCFAFPDIVVLTDNSKFSREAWGDEDD
jgi:hypothetical protein